MPLSIFNIAPAHWERTTLGDAVARGGGDIRTGPFGSQLHASDYVPVGVPTIMPVNIGDNRLIRDGIACISEDDAARLSQHIVQKGDIIYSRRGDVKRRALVRDAEDGWFCGTGCLKVRLGDGYLDPEYVSYYLGHPEVQDWILRHAVGATMPNLNTSIMGAVPILAPPLAEQRRIASILGSLDDKIEHNRRTAQALERLARAIFKAWFVDFEPVKAKAEGATSFASMPQDVFDALPTTFVDTEIGPVPEGWGVETLAQHVKVDRGLSYKGAGLRTDNTGLPMHNLNSVREGGGYKDEGIKYYAGDYRDRHVLDAGDVIVTNTEQGFDRLLIAHAAIVPAYFGRTGLFSQHLYRVRPLAGSQLTSTFLAHLFNEPRWHQHISGYANGTTVNMLPRDALEMPSVPIPPVQIVKRFSEIDMAMRHLRERNHLESRKLTSARDLLLPRLVSGDIQTRD